MLDSHLKPSPQPLMPIKKFNKISFLSGLKSKLFEYPLHIKIQNTTVEKQSPKWRRWHIKKPAWEAGPSTRHLDIVSGTLVNWGPRDSRVFATPSLLWQDSGFGAGRGDVQTQTLLLDFQERKADKIACHSPLNICCAPWQSDSPVLKWGQIQSCQRCEPLGSMLSSCTVCS